MNNTTFLDIDDEIWKKKLILPGNDEDREFENVMKQLDQKPFFLVQPSPGACIKTKTEAGEKVFLNICTTDKIPPPDDISDTELFSILSEEAPSFTIPMSIGNERLEADNSKNLCSTYDIALNTSYFKKCQEKKNFWLFTISVIMSGVSDKFNKVLKTDEYVVLQNKKVMGKLQQHRIENRQPQKQAQIKKPLVEEIHSSVSNQQAQRPEDACNRRVSNYVLLKYPSKGSPTLLIGLFKVPRGSLAKDVTVLLYEDRIVVEVVDANLMYDVCVPYKIQVGNTKSFIDANLGVLRVNIPVENVNADTDE